jgi:hypothetical protein
MNGDLHGLWGNTGSLSAQALLDALLDLGHDGTVTLQRGAGTLITLLGEGRVKATHKLGQASALDQGGYTFRFQPHAPSDLPLLDSDHPGSALAAVRALPHLGGAQELPTELIDLRALLDHLRRRSFSGSLTTRFESEQGLVLLLRGRIGAALFERDGFVLDRGNALRSLYRHCLEGRAPLRLEALDGVIVRALLGLALVRLAGATNPDTYSGIHATEQGYTFYRSGKAYLHVAAELTGSSQRYAPLADDADIDEPQLPDDPPGWEDRRFALTLRGRDALNPMTELAMEFGQTFGGSGRNILDTLGKGLTLEETATRLKFDLQELKPWLKRLQEDGLIREQGL